MEKEKNCEQMTCDCQPFEHSLQKESEWEGVFQLVMEDIGKRYRVSDELFDVLSDSLSKHLPEAITTVVSNREKEIAEEVEKKRKEPTHSGTGSISWYNQALDEVLLIIKK